MLTTFKKFKHYDTGDVEREYVGYVVVVDRFIDLSGYSVFVYGERVSSLFDEPIRDVLLEFPTVEAAYTYMDALPEVEV